MSDLQAFLVITLLTWAAVSVSGTTPELSTTTGDTVNIPCLFGEGTLRNIYWYYSDGTGPQKILVLTKEGLIIEAEYASRASLQNDNSTLILNDITVADEGTYRCDVDRQGQTAVPNINTKLNVFSLRLDTLPMISPCTGADESSSCSIHANQSFTLTCTLPNVYPVKDTELIWYQDGKLVSSTDGVTHNDDGTTNVSTQIQVSETGNYTCNATYHSANGREKTAVSVDAWIIAPTDVPNTPGKKMTTGQIVGMTICIVLLVGISLGIIILFIVCPKARAHCPFSNNTNSDNKSDQGESRQLTEITTENSSKESKHAEDTTTPLISPITNISTATTTHATAASISTTNSQHTAGEGDRPTPQNSGAKSQQCQVDNSPRPPSTTVTQGGNVNRSHGRIITDEEIVKLSEHMPGDKYSNFCVALGMDLNPSNNIKAKHQINYSAAFEEILKTWSTKTGGFTQVLDDALVKADLGGLRYKYKID